MSLEVRQDFRSLQHVLDKIGSSGQSSLATRTLAQTISQNTPELMTGGQVGALQRGALGASYADTVRKTWKMVYSRLKKWHPQAHPS